MKNIKLTLAENEVLETERLILRKMTLADAQDLFEIWSDPQVTEMTGVQPDQKIEQTKNRIVNYFIPDRLILWGLEEKVSHKMIGFIEIHPNGDQADLGWMLNHQFWGQGLMPEAARCICQLAFEQLNLDILTASCKAGNRNSTRVMEKIGMRQLGQLWHYMMLKEKSVLSDYWAMTREEYEAMDVE